MTEDEAPNIDSILNAVFGPKPRGGGGRVGRWYTMRSLVRYLIESSNHETFYNDIIYGWSAREGVRPDTAEGLIEHISMIPTKNGKPTIEVQATNPKIVRWLYGMEKSKKK